MTKDDRLFELDTIVLPFFFADDEGVAFELRSCDLYVELALRSCDLWFDLEFFPFLGCFTNVSNSVD